MISGVPHRARAQAIIDRLGLVPHPERGFYAETYRAPAHVRDLTRGADRSASTAIYFFVTADEPVTSLHRLASDEIFTCTMAARSTSCA